MKSKTILSFIFMSALASIATLPACAGTFTKQDAVDIGGQLAKSSLDLATREFAGEKINFKYEIGQMGLQAASKAIDKVAYNLSKPATVTPTDVVAAAAVVAQSRIGEAAVPDPQIQTRAVVFADQAADIAQIRLQGSAPNAPPGADAGR